MSFYNNPFGSTTFPDSEHMLAYLKSPYFYSINMYRNSSLLIESNKKSNPTPKEPSSKTEKNKLKRLEKLSKSVAESVLA
jgi:hypothetical protein